MHKASDVLVFYELGNALCICDIGSGCIANFVGICPSGSPQGVMVFVSAEYVLLILFFFHKQLSCPSFDLSPPNFRISIWGVLLSGVLILVMALVPSLQDYSFEPLFPGLSLFLFGLSPFL